MLREAINEAMKGAMKSQDKLKLSTVRLINAAIKNADIEARSDGKGPLADEELLSPAAADDQAAPASRSRSTTKAAARSSPTRSAARSPIIQGFLPQPMPEPEAKAAIAQAIKETGAQGMKDMGKVMAALRQRHAGKMDFDKASVLVKSLLAG